MNAGQNDRTETLLLVETEMQEWFVAPGKSTYIPVRLTNKGETTKILLMSVEGLPANWLELVPEKVVILPGEQKEVAIVIQPPDSPQTAIGRYPIRVAATQTENGGEQAFAEGTLTVAAYEVQGRIAILIDAIQFSVAPGSSITVNFTIINQGLEEDTFRLSVEGIPPAWISTAMPSIRLRPGEQKQISLLIRPPHHSQSRAGRNPFTVNIESQLNPSEVATVECILTMEAYSEFTGLVKPAKISAGEMIQVGIENKGNIPESYSLICASTNQTLGFELVDDDPPKDQLSAIEAENHPKIDEEGAVRMRIPPGETGFLHFRSKLINGPNLIGNHILPYRVNITASDGTAQTYTGEVVSQGLIPVWVVQVGILALLGMMCLASFFFVRGNVVSGQATETAIALLVGSTQTAEVSASQTAGATQTASANMTQAAEAGQQDSDGDGLTNVQEAELGTDPLVADTDADGLSDGVEFVGTTNPLNSDTDGDALIDGDEVQRGTDPLNQDTDADSLTDGQEIQVGTDPLKSDSDSDGLLDGAETPPCPDPLNPDSDSDALIDGQDIEPCDPNNPSLTATAIAANPSATLAPPAETPTGVLTEVPTGTLEPTATSVPSIPPLEGIIALVSNRDGNPEIYSLNLTDMSMMRLTIDPAVEAQPARSPDGTRIAFATNRDGNFEIYVMNSDGTGLVNLTNHASDDFDPAWSVDGSQIVYVSNRDGNNEIYVMNADGTNPVNVTNDPANDSQPTWFLQTGTIPTVRIAFTSDRDGNQEIYSINPSGIDPNNLTNNVAEDFSPAGLSNSGLLVFITDRDGNQEVYVMEQDGSSQGNLTNSIAEDWSPTWDSLGEWIAFVTNRDGNQEIYIVKNDGSEQYNLTMNPAEDFDPAW